MTGLQLMQAHDIPCPVVATTGNVSTDCIRSYNAVGFAGVLGKPFNVSRLRKALRKTQEQGARTGALGSLSPQHRTLTQSASTSSLGDFFIFVKG